MVANRDGRCGGRSDLLGWECLSSVHIAWFRSHVKTTRLILERLTVERLILERGTGSTVDSGTASMCSRRPLNLERTRPGNRTRTGGSGETTPTFIALWAGFSFR